MSAQEEIEALHTKYPLHPFFTATIALMCDHKFSRFYQVEIEYGFNDISDEPVAWAEDENLETAFADAHSLYIKWCDALSSVGVDLNRAKFLSKALNEALGVELINVTRENWVKKPR